MATDVSIVLETLHCLREQDEDVSGFVFGSLPYIWPVLLRIDEMTLDTESLIQVVAPSLGDARVVIKGFMRRGESADIPTSVGVLPVRLETNLFNTRLILVVALWEEDGTPDSVVRAGFQAFVRELGAAIGNVTTLIELRDADPERTQELIAAVKSQVEDRVKSTMKGALSGPQKAAIWAGFMNLDDLLGSAHLPFPNAVPQPFSLGFGSGSPNVFEIRGRIEAREVRVEPCQAQLKAVRDAQVGVNAVNLELRELGERLRAASPQQKPYFVEEIRRVRREDLAAALHALAQARVALSICRVTSVGQTSNTLSIAE